MTISLIIVDSSLNFAHMRLIGAKSIEAGMLRIHRKAGTSCKTSQCTRLFQAMQISLFCRKPPRSVVIVIVFWVSICIITAVSGDMVKFVPVQVL